MEGADGANKSENADCVNRVDVLISASVISQQIVSDLRSVRAAQDAQTAKSV